MVIHNLVSDAFPGFQGATTQAWTAGMHGVSAVMTGPTGGYINYGTAAALCPPRMSAAILFKSNNASPANDRAIAARTNSTTWTQGWAFNWLSPPAKRMKFWINGYSANFAYFDVAEPRDWHLYVGTYDGATVRIYVDGVKGTDDSYTGSVTAGTNPTEIGRGGHSTYSDDGACAGFWQWDRPLSQEEAIEFSLRPWQIYTVKRPGISVISAGQPFSLRNSLMRQGVQTWGRGF